VLYGVVPQVDGVAEVDATDGAHGSRHHLQRFVRVGRVVRLHGLDGCDRLLWRTIGQVNHQLGQSIR